jgi:hypothetical protein
MSERAIYKSTAAEFLDDLFGGTPDDLEGAYADALDLLMSIGDAPLSEAAAHLVESGRLEPDAVADSAKGWRAGPEVDRVLRAGYRQAMELASSRSEPVPIETLWMTGSGKDFELHICDGKRHVTVVLLLPLERSYGSQRAATRSWAVRVDAGEVVMVQTSGGQAESAV